MWFVTSNGITTKTITQSPELGTFYNNTTINVTVGVGNDCGYNSVVKPQQIITFPKYCLLIPQPIMYNGKIENNNKSYIIYPNPASQTVNVKFDSDNDDNFNIQIYDMMGKQVYNSNSYFAEGSHEINIDVKDFPNGIYYVISGNKDNRTSEKLIITH